MTEHLAIERAEAV